MSISELRFSMSSTISPLQANEIVTTHIVIPCPHIVKSVVVSLDAVGSVVKIRCEAGISAQEFAIDTVSVLGQDIALFVCDGSGGA